MGFNAGPKPTPTAEAGAPRFNASSTTSSKSSGATCSTSACLSTASQAHRESSRHPRCGGTGRSAPARRPQNLQSPKRLQPRHPRTNAARQASQRGHPRTHASHAVAPKLGWNVRQTLRRCGANPLRNGHPITHPETPDLLQDRTREEQEDADHQLGFRHQKHLPLQAIQERYTANKMSDRFIRWSGSADPRIRGSAGPAHENSGQGIANTRGPPCRGRTQFEFDIWPNADPRARRIRILLGSRAGPIETALRECYFLRGSTTLDEANDTPHGPPEHELRLGGPGTTCERTTGRGRQRVSDPTDRGRSPSIFPAGRLYGGPL